MPKTARAIGTALAAITLTVLAATSAQALTTAVPAAAAVSGATALADTPADGTSCAGCW